MPTDFPPYIIHTQQKPQGLFIDYWNLVASKSNLKIEFIPMTLKEMLAGVETGTIDIPLAYFYFKEMESSLTYIKTLAPVHNDIYLKTVTRHKGANLIDLTNKRIAVLESSMFFRYLSKNHPEVIPVTFTAITELSQLIKNEEIDGFLGERQTSWRFINQSNLLGKVKRIEIPQLDNHFHIALPNDNKMLMNIITEAISKVEPSEFKHLAEKWLKDETQINRHFPNALIYSTKNQGPSSSHELIEKKTAPEVNTNDLHLNLFEHLAPYVIQDSIEKGIIYDLILRVFYHANINVNQISYTHFRALNIAIDQTSDIDISLVTSKKNQQLFYSDELLHLQNVVLSKKSNLVAIKHINDLKKLNVIGYKGANRELGSPFKYTISSLEKTAISYRELGSKLQIQALLDNAVDAIIIDKNIALWELSQLNINSFEQFNIDDIFPRKSPLYLAFKEPNLASRFNIGLRQIKHSGLFNKIIEDYQTKRAQFKYKNASKIGEILSDIGNRIDKSLLNKNLTFLSTLPSVSQISITKKLEKGMEKQEDSNVISQPLPPSNTRVLNIVFDDKVIDSLLKKNKSHINIQPLKALENFRDYEKRFTKEIKSNFSINLTPQERDYIKNNPTLPYAEVDWPPLIRIENNNMIGPIADYLDLVSQLSGLQFELVSANNWEHVQKQFIEGKTAIIPSVDHTIEPHSISIPYTEFSYAILTKKNHRYYSTMEELKNKTITVVGAKSPIVNQETLSDHQNINE